MVSANDQHRSVEPWASCDSCTVNDRWRGSARLHELPLVWQAVYASQHLWTENLEFWINLLWADNSLSWTVA